MFTGKENLFLDVSMKNCGRRKVWKHKEIRGSDKYVTLKKHKDIRGSDKYVTLEISSKFDSLDNMKTISSESKGKLETSGKGLVTSMGFKTKVRSKKYIPGQTFSFPGLLSLCLRLVFVQCLGSHKFPVVTQPDTQLREGSIILKAM